MIRTRDKNHETDKKNKIWIAIFEGLEQLKRRQKRESIDNFASAQAKT